MAKTRRFGIDFICGETRVEIQEIVLMRRVGLIIGVTLALTAEPSVTRARDVDKPKPQTTIDIDVDATDAARKIIHAKLSLPAVPGPMTLYYPKWIPGEHGPNGPINDLAGLKLAVGSKPLPWRRDEVDMFAFHCEVPKEAKTLEVTLDFLSPPSSTAGFSSAASMTTKLAVINWNQLVLYPKGPAMDQIECRASLRVPAGWKLGTALPIASQNGQETRFAPVTLETLIDSTVLCGAHFREIPIGPADGPRHFLEIASDSTAALEVSPELRAQFDRLVTESGALFGARHYRSYRFLLALSDRVTHFGEEHHESTDIRGPERALIDETARNAFIGVCPHEFVHSWNGKHRRPADMITKDFQQPERTRLLWVYEGLTQYLGMVLTARSGLWTPEFTRAYLAQVIEEQQNQRGRSWRPLEDTTVAAQFLYGARNDWAAWRRGVDFYDEGILIWLEVDTLIREKTKGERSLDDFCRRFHGGSSGPPWVKPYALDDIVADLNAVTPHDWKALLTRRTTATGEQAPVNGVARSGWRLGFGDKASAYLKAHEAASKRIDLTASIGILLGDDGVVTDVIPGKAAHQAGVGPGMKLVAVNSRRWSAEVLRDAVGATKTAKARLELLFENEEFFKTYALEYHDGLKYPCLERDSTKADLLDAILKAQTNTRPLDKPAAAGK
jgi:predicted metalloprotease with PDZ domain